ncbi:MAG: prepilin peptidase [Paracoccaceae bacterium]
MSELIPLLAALPLLALAAWRDLRSLRIPDALSVAVLVMAIAFLIAMRPDDLLVRIAVAASVFAVGFVLFGAGLVGGGDVKLLPAFLLMVPVRDHLGFALALSAGILVSVALIAGLRRVPGGWKRGFRSLSARGGLPLGLAIAFAAAAETAAVAVMAS